MTQEMFRISTFCTIHEVEYSFIESLKSEGLINVASNEEGEFIEEEHLRDLEIYTRLHSELGINPAGIDVIHNLMEKILFMQQEMRDLKNRLRLYEE